MPRRRKHQETEAANDAKIVDGVGNDGSPAEIPAALETPVIEKDYVNEDDPLATSDLLAAIVHHGGGVEKVNKSFLAEGIGSRLILDIEHTDDAYILRTRIAAPTDEA